MNLAAPSGVGMGCRHGGYGVVLYGADLRVPWVSRTAGGSLIR